MAVVLGADGLSTESALARVGYFRHHQMPGITSQLLSAQLRFGALFLEVMFGDGALEYEERELVAAVTAAAQDCVY